eukprot:CAMPEP_0202890332 /NCGR_PEP_ID=MMETSP1392-20130828/778_1 /ASSEMBLY_ACC=CAM_ASM_000868 /TAXON_ID=225041 /ORGANISM="Chlamydomonas chlamydogama, Strain SAG 11-48b" /LENGTH=316 /DNA_ID=CAMNT_0049573881 /DNA_START=29 /DNA_END=979 /DNA_ORIENTATION=+
MTDHVGRGYPPGSFPPTNTFGQFYAPAPMQFPSGLYKAGPNFVPGVSGQSSYYGRSQGRGGGAGRMHHPKKQHNNVPNLSQLRQENKRKARRHFKGAFGRTPHWSVPRAPENNTSYLITAPGSSLISPAQNGFHAVTPNPFLPGTAWKNGYGTMDKEAAEMGAAAGIDMFGSNAGLITTTEVDGDEHGEGNLSDEEQRDPFGFELHVDDENGESSLPAAVRQRMDEQTAYICQLEENNLKLQERVYLLEQQLMQVQGRFGPQPAGSQQEDSHQEDSRHDDESQSHGASADMALQEAVHHADDALREGDNPDHGQSS